MYRIALALGLLIIPAAAIEYTRKNARRWCACSASAPTWSLRQMETESAAGDIRFR